MRILETSVSIWLMAGMLITAGICFSFFGHRLLHLFLGIIGFLVGAVAGFVLVSSYAGDAGVLLMASGVVGGGFTGVLFSLLFFFVDLFLMGAYMGILVIAVPSGILAALLKPSFGSYQGPVIKGVLIGALLIPGVIGGWLALIYRRILIIFFTALNGAFYAVIGMWLLVHVDSLRSLLDGPAAQIVLHFGSTMSSSELGLWCFLTLCGGLYQYVDSSAREAKREREEQKP